MCSIRVLCGLCFSALHACIHRRSALHLACGGGGGTVLRHRRIKGIPHAAARRHHRGACPLGGASAHAVQRGGLAAALLHLREHREVRLCDRSLRFLLRLGTLQRTREHFTPLLDPCHLFIQIGIVVLQVLLVRRRELAPLSQLLTDQCLAVRVGFFPHLLQLARLQFARLHRRAHRLREALSRFHAILHLTSEILQLRILSDPSDSLEQCHVITSV